MSLRERLAHFLLGDTIEDLVQQRLAKSSHAGPVSVRVDDSPGWESLSGSGPADRPWADKYTDLEETLAAWRKNVFIRRLVTLTRSYAVAGGLTLASEDPDVDAFVQAFWHHRQNRMDRRMGPICDELTRAGEIFPVLFTNRVSGMSYVRFVPAFQIRTIETDPDDYEVELRYAQTQQTTAQPKWWIGPGHPHAFSPPPQRGGSEGGRNPLPALMLHFAVNRPIGATRGESDLTPALPWAKRYSEWLKDRVRLNRIRTRQAILHLRISDPALVEQKRQQLRTHNPIETGIYVSGPDEELIAHALGIGAGDAEDDGRTLRLAVATAGNVGLHFLGEGETVNYATAKEMGEPTTRFYAERQEDLIHVAKQIVTSAYRRYKIVTTGSDPAVSVADGTSAGACQVRRSLTATAAEVARKDNESLALAAKDIVQALAQMREHGWIDDKTAIPLAFKFAGEPLGQDQIERILQTGGRGGSQ
jgi:hypothetical protein